MKQITLLILLAAAATALGGGPLTPSGAPAPGMKALDQIDSRTPISGIPYSITTPGAYYLTNNVTVYADTTCIGIMTNNVTIDLCGFTMDRTATGPYSAIYLMAGLSGLTVRNGTISGWETGIEAPGPNCRIEDITIRNCKNGIDTGIGAIISRCRVFNTTVGTYGNAYSIRTDDCSLILDSIIQSNTSASEYVYGFTPGRGSLVSHCIAAYVASDAAESPGFSMAESSLCSECLAKSCSAGFHLSSYTLLLNSTLMNCVTNGINAGDFVRVANCTLDSNGDEGIQTGTYGGQVDRCNILASRGEGIIASRSCSVRDCTVRQCGAAGIEAAGDDVMVMGNNCTYNGQLVGAYRRAGISAESYGSWAHKNTCIYNYAGLQDLGWTNIFTANSSRWNDSGANDYIMDSYSQYGQILSGPGPSFTNANPWANIQF